MPQYGVHLVPGQPHFEYSRTNEHRMESSEAGELQQCLQGEEADRRELSAMHAAIRREAQASQ